MGASVCILTNVHSPLDQRIFYKEAQTLSAAGYQVTIVGPGDPALDGDKDGVRIETIPPPPSVFDRIVNVGRLWGAAHRSDYTLYHIQDPELLPLGLLLRAAGRQVIYDVHEHYPKVAYARHWIPRLLRRPISVLVDLVERVAATGLNGVLGVVDEQGERFGGKGSFEVVKNYPKAEWFEPNGHFQGDGGHELIHVGSLSRDRGSEFILEVMRELKKTHPRARLHTVGPFQTAGEEEIFRRKVEDYDLVDEVWCETESVPYEKLGDVIRRHRVGLIPGQATVKNMSPFVPTKLFEYLACGIPVVASVLPSIKGFYAEGDWGVLADPADPVAHAEAIGYLLSHPEEASDKGARGRALILEKFNWDVESRKLLAFYDRVLKT